MKVMTFIRTQDGTEGQEEVEEATIAMTMTQLNWVISICKSLNDSFFINCSNYFY